jgi:hypothetical protein
MNPYRRVPRGELLDAHLATRRPPRWGNAAFGRLWLLLDLSVLLDTLQTVKRMRMSDRPRRKTRTTNLFPATGKEGQDTDDCRSEDHLPSNSLSTRTHHRIIPLKVTAIVIEKPVSDAFSSGRP